MTTPLTTSSMIALNAAYANYAIPEPPFSEALLAVERFAPEQLAVIRYTDAPDGLKALAHFWTLRLKPIRTVVQEGDPTSDNELGWGLGGTEHWMLEQLGSPYTGKVYNLYLVLYKETMELVAIFGIVREDRGVLAEQGLVATLAFGYFQVDYRLRGKGIGNIMVACACALLQLAANQDGLPKSGVLFTDDEAAMHIYDKNGWRKMNKSVAAAGIAGVKGLPDTEQLYARVWNPASPTFMPKGLEIIEPVEWPEET